MILGVIFWNLSLHNIYLVETKLHRYIESNLENFDGYVSNGFSLIKSNQVCID